MPDEIGKEKKEDKKKAKPKAKPKAVVKKRAPRKKAVAAKKEAAPPPPPAAPPPLPKVEAAPEPAPFEPGPTHRKADVFNRYIAKFVDFLIAGALFTIPLPVGPVAAVTYLLIADGLKGGASPGKRMAGLKVISPALGDIPCDFRLSIVRNGIFAAVYLGYYVFGWIPYVGCIVVLVGGASVIAYESLLVFNEEQGIRFGDKVAETMVVDAD